MPRDEKGKAKPLTLSESKELKGSAAELASLEAAKAKAAAEEAQVKGTTESVVAEKVDTGKPAKKAAKKAVKKGATVERDPNTGKAVKKVPKLLGAPVKSQDPKPYIGQTMTAVTGETIRPGTNTELRRGIPSKVVRDQTKPVQSAGPRLPRIGQAYKHSDGRIMRVTAENIDEVHADAKRTVLPEAGRDVMEPVGRPAPLPGPRGGLRPADNRNVSGNRAGLGVAHDVAKDHADRAIGHLETMAASEHGSGPYRQAKKSFGVVHKAMGAQNMSKSIHNMLQLAHNHIDTKQKGTEKMLGALKDAVGAKLREGKLAEEERAWRQMQNE